MNKINIVLVDTDEKYLMPIELRLIEGLDGKLELNVITDLEYLKEYFSVPRQIDILIINEDIYNNDFNKQNISNIFLLVEDLYKRDMTESLNLHRIYKYSSVKEIYSEIINKSLLESSHSTSRGKIIMVYSPSGGSGKTTVAAGIAAVLKSSYKRVIYINTEILQSFKFIIDNENKFSSPEVAELLEIKDEDIVHKLNLSIGKNGFDYLLPFKQSLSSLNVDMDKFIFLAEKLRESKMYDYIIVDTSNDLTSQKSMLMGIADKVVIVTTQEKSDVLKLDILRKNIDYSNVEKFIFICNKYIYQKENYLINSNYINGININEYIDFFDEENLNIKNLSKNRSFIKLTYSF